METRQGKLNILMLPWLAHGFISPFQELAKKLSQKNFHILFCSTPINLSSIKKKINKKYIQSIQLIELHLPPSPELPPRYQTTNGLPTHLMPSLKTAFERSSPSFSKTLETLTPDLVIYDFNLPWAAAAASSLNIPAVVFWPFGVVFASFALHVCNNLAGVEYPFQAIYLRDSEKPDFQKLFDVSSKDRSFSRTSSTISQCHLYQDF
ncbi:beta-D-glucosyl crocetin beta-1,6-glucosyltransferase [Sarracenia purpurea var. burkii]